MPLEDSVRIGRHQVQLQRFHPLPRSWIAPGGIVWLGLAVYLLGLLGIYGATAGYVPAVHRGIPYVAPEHRLRAIDVQRLIGGQVIRNARGDIVLDPAADRIRIATIDKNGTTVPRFETSPDSESPRHVVVLIPRPGLQYRDVVAALDAILADPPAKAVSVWIAPPM